MARTTARADAAFDAGLPDYAARNRAHWDAAAAAYQAVQGRQLSGSGGLAWGVWQIPEADLHVLGEVAGRTTLELGCGAAQWSIGLARQGATAIGVDLSEAQLKAAWVAARDAGVAVRLIHASAEAVPLPDASVDIAFCDWGALRFADPDRVVPEAARLLRAGGLLAFSTATALLDLCWADGADAPGVRLLRDYFGLGRLELATTTEFQRTDGAWIRLFRSHGFSVEELIELRPPEDATTTFWEPEVLDWARRWPAEQIWRVRREGRLVFADTARLDGAIAEKLSQPAVAAGGIAMASVLIAPGTEDRLATLRALGENFRAEVGCSAWNGIALVRLCAKDGAALRHDLIALLAALGQPVPRLWLQ